jgi:Mrp family chromosome partitioning ATPase
MKEIRLKILGDSAIVVGDVEVVPSASHLFAVLLLLSLAPAEGISRRELQELLFGGADEDKASHRLRQLFYRLRSFGVVLRDAPGGALQVANPIGDPTSGANGDGTHRPSGALRALPHYNPRLPAPFLAWLESARERVEREAQARLLRQLREAHSRQDWSTTSGIADVVLLTDPLNEEVAAAGAESRAMLGQRDEALEIADRFVREFDDDDAAAQAMRKLRARIARTTLSHREGTLRGREECLAFLTNQWEQASRGGGRLSLVVGPPGIGKTRVAEAFSAKIRLEGRRVISYQCDRQASQHPLALFSAVLPELQALSGSLGVSPEHRTVLERLGPSAAVTSGELPGLAAVEARRAELQRALIDLLEAISVERPLLLVIDDAHLLDDASSEILRTLADSENGAAVLVAGFTRPRTDGTARLTQARRASSYLLPPLTEEQSRGLLLELRSGRLPNEEQIRWTLSQAKGNPFYVYALASMTSEQGTLPAHVRSLATCSYFALSPTARTVLESCLLLDTLATLKRVSRIGGMDEPALLTALRELEELDLVHFEGGRLRGPHAILDEALRQLIPGSVSAMLHVRIAEALAEECVAEGYALSLAWAAVQSWLAAGDPRAAVDLACRSAREAAELGEPQAGAELLHQIPRTNLPPECQRQLLDDLYQLANAGNCQSLLVDALRDRMALAIDLQEGAQVQATVRLNLIANAMQNGGDRLEPIGNLEAILRDSRIANKTRFDAGRRLIALADLQFDSKLANDTYAYLRSLCDVEDYNDTSFVNAALIYHAAFGEEEGVLAIAATVPSLLVVNDDTARALASNASLALLRIGHYTEARDLALSTFEQMNAKGILGAAEFALAMLTEADICLGALESAEHWVDRWEQLANRRRAYQPRYYSGYLSTKFLIALYRGRYAEAEGILNDYLACGYLSSPRHRAVSLAHSLLLRLWAGTSSPTAVEIRELEILYERGRHLGAQDSCIEALWCIAVSAERPDHASRLLGDYLNIHRRERALPEWSLRRTTSRDPAWLTSAYASSFRKRPTSMP